MAATTLAPLAFLCATLAAGEGIPSAAVLIVPQDAGAQAALARFTEPLEEALASRYELRPSTDLFGHGTPEAATEARQRAATLLAEGKKLLAAGRHADAEAKLKSVLPQVDLAAAGMQQCAEYCETLAHLAAAQLARKDEAAARETLRALLNVEKVFKFDGPAFGKPFQTLAKDVRQSAEREGRVGVLSLKTEPPGGSVYLDGQFKGLTPLVLDRVPATPHLLRIEKTGYLGYGKLATPKVSEELEVLATLNPTREFSALEPLMQQLSSSLQQGERKELLTAGERLNVERAIVGTLRSTPSEKLVLDCAVLDYGPRAQVTRRDRTFDGDEYGQLEKEVRRFANSILASADAPEAPAAKKAAKDPLDTHSGMEDWDEERDDESPRKPAAKGDPLDHASGTDEW